MPIYQHEGNQNTLSIYFDSQVALLCLSGFSYQAYDKNAPAYWSLFNRLELYATCPKPKIQVDIELIDYTIHAGKLIYAVLGVLEKIHSDDHKVEVNWYYEESDEEMYEAGCDIAKLLALPMFIKPYRV